MLKPSTFLLFLLNFLQISASKCSPNIREINNFNSFTQNVTSDKEWKTINETMEYFNKIDWREAKRKITEIGDTLKWETDKLSELDQRLAVYEENYPNYMMVCLSDEKFSDRKVSELTPYNRTILNEYEQFFDVLSGLPRVDVDLLKINKRFEYVTDADSYKEVRTQAVSFGSHLYCLQHLRTSFDDTSFNELFNLYTTYAYITKWTELQEEDDRIQRNKDLIFFFSAIAVVLAAIATFSPQFRRLWRSFQQPLANFITDCFEFIVHYSIAAGRLFVRCMIGLKDRSIALIRAIWIRVTGLVAAGWNRVAARFRRNAE